MGLIGLNQSVSRVVLLLEALGENLLPCLFQPLHAAHIPQLLVHSSIFKASITLPLIDLPLSTIVKGHLRLHWAHLGDPAAPPYFKISSLVNVIPSANLVPPCNITLSQVLGIKHGHLWDAIILPTTDGKLLHTL